MNHVLIHMYDVHGACLGSIETLTDDEYPTFHKRGGMEPTYLVDQLRRRSDYFAQCVNVRIEVALPFTREAERALVRP